MPSIGEDPEFVKEQYAQYWEMKRFHLALSWHIPALAIAAVVAFIGFDPDKITKWTRTPALPAVILLTMAMFVLLMALHHHRNLLFARLYEKAIAELEETHGIVKEVHHQQVSVKLTGFEKISSSVCLSFFLLVLAVALIIGSGYFWICFFL